jgi:hypothetical protein
MNVLIRFISFLSKIQSDHWQSREKAQAENVRGRRTKRH